MPKLNNQVALVTGASRGVGKGIALELAGAGSTVYITGRTPEDMKYITGKGIALECDHRDDQQMEAAAWLDLSNSESPQFIGRAIVALAADPKIVERSGQVLIAASLAQEYGFTDIDGRTPRPLTLSEV
jgi:NAD(P)-dependent dehydrogenase (short-subunit alcohol dehydrogenase family)